MSADASLKAKTNATENLLLKLQLDIIRELREWKQEFLEQIGTHVLKMLDLHEGRADMLDPYHMQEDTEPDEEPRVQVPKPRVKALAHLKETGKEELDLTEESMDKIREQLKKKRKVPEYHTSAGPSGKSFPI